MGVAAVRSDFVWSPALIVREYTMVTGSLFERLETFPVIVTTVSSASSRAVAPS